MLSRPTTEQVLLDCARELLQGVLPALTEPTAQVTVVMIESVLRSMAERAAHEIAWMREEIEVIEPYVRDAGVPLDDLAAAPGASLHLDEVVETYNRAGRALSAALEAAVARSDADLIARGEALLAQRAQHEKQAMAGWSPTGR